MVVRDEGQHPRMGGRVCQSPCPPFTFRKMEITLNEFLFWVIVLASVFMWTKLMEG